MNRHEKNATVTALASLLAKVLAGRELSDGELSGALTLLNACNEQFARIHLDADIAQISASASAKLKHEAGPVEGVGPT